MHSLVITLQLCNLIWE